MKSIILALLLLPGIAWADFNLQKYTGKPVVGGFHLLTTHSPSNGANDLNVGAFVKTDKDYLFGAYYNSYHRLSLYAGWTSPEWNRLAVSVVGVTGYFSPVTPVLIPSLRIYTNDAGVSFYLSGSPVKLSKDGQSVIHLSASWAL